MNTIYLSYHLSKLCYLLFISFLLFIQFRSISAGAPLFQYRYRRSIGIYSMPYWPSLSLDAVYIGQVFFFFAFLWTHDANVQTLDQTRLIYKAMYKNWTKENFLPRNFIFNAENPERVRLAHLACSSSQSEQRNRFILPTRNCYYLLLTWDLWKHPSFLFRVSTTLE